MYSKARIDKSAPQEELLYLYDAQKTDSPEIDKNTRSNLEQEA